MKFNSTNIEVMHSGYARGKHAVAGLDCGILLTHFVSARVAGENAVSIRTVDYLKEPVQGNVTTGRLEKFCQQEAESMIDRNTAEMGILYAPDCVTQILGTIQTAFRIVEVTRRWAPRSNLIVRGVISVVALTNGTIYFLPRANLLTESPDPLSQSMYSGMWPPKTTSPFPPPRMKRHI